MSLFKRISTTLVSRIDSVVGEIENHDALIKAAITDQKKKLATAKVQLAGIQTGEQRVKDQMADNQVAIRKWEQRAIKEAATDEAKALVCLQRKQDAQHKYDKLNAMLNEYRQTRQKIEKDIRRTEDELKGMIQKHELMRARQSSVDAMSVINETGNATIENIQSSFDRWEIQLAQGEMCAGPVEEIDLLEQEYITEEQQDDLKDELANLLNPKKPDAV